MIRAHTPAHIMILDQTWLIYNKEHVPGVGNVRTHYPDLIGKSTDVW